jgi:hypothetical protein
MSGHGHTAYAAYYATVGGKTHDGKPIPKWDALGDTIQAAWTMAALAAIAQHEALKEQP